MQEVDENDRYSYIKMDITTGRLFIGFSDSDQKHFISLKNVEFEPSLESLGYIMDEDTGFPEDFLTPDGCKPTSSYKMTLSQATTNAYSILGDLYSFCDHYIDNEIILSNYAYIKMDIATSKLFIGLNNSDKKNFINLKNGKFEPSLESLGYIIDQNTGLPENFLTPDGCKPSTSYKIELEETTIKGHNAQGNLYDFFVNLQPKSAIKPDSSRSASYNGSMEI